MATALWFVLRALPWARSSFRSRWTDAELYWLIENGIKDTGTIALGPTHSERDVWAVAAFVRQLPELKPERYHELVSQ
jgi:hypothetical protein